MTIRARRGLGLPLLLAWLLVPAIQALDPTGRDGHGACADGLCRCRHDRPSPPPASPSCHDAPAAPRSCEMSSGCHHEREAVPVAAGLDGILAPSEGLRPRLVSLPAVPEAAGGPAAGHARIDPPPPRPARPA